MKTACYKTGRASDYENAGDTMPYPSDSEDRCACDCCDERVLNLAHVLHEATDAFLEKEGKSGETFEIDISKFTDQIEGVEASTHKLIQAMASGSGVSEAVSALNEFVKISVAKLFDEKNDHYKRVKLSKASIKLNKLQKHRGDLKKMLLKKISPAYIDALMAMISKNDEDAFLDDDTDAE